MSGRKVQVWLAAMVLMAGVARLAAAGADVSLIKAAERGDRDAVRELPGQKADMNSPEADGTTALAWAAYRNDLETAELLIAAGADMDAANDYGVTPLTLACANGSDQMVSILLTAGADSDKAQWTGETPLMTCAGVGNVAAVRALIRSGANLEAHEEKKGQTALMWAVAEKKPAVVKVLLDAGADVHARSKLIRMDREPYSILCSEADPCMGGEIEGNNYAETIHFAGSAGGFTPLLFAARVGDIESAHLLLAAGADPDEATEEEGSTLVVAAASGHEELALLLLEAGADPNATDAFGIKPLHYCLHEGLLKISSAKPKATDSLGWERPNLPELMRALLTAGADPNARIEHDFPPYDYAPIARSNGNNLPQISLVGVTPFFLAAANSDVMAMRYLVERRADPKISTIETTTPLMVASGISHERGGAGFGGMVTEEYEKSSDDWNRTLEAVKMAVDLGVDVNAANVDERTALHGAVFMGDTRLIRYLVEQGADLEAKDKYGQSPMTIALGDPEGLVYRQLPGGRYDYSFRQSKVNKDVADLLVELGAKPFTGKYRDRSGE